jgi:cobalt-zinc-cadmium efflux system membrane fusion protein
MGLTNPLLKAAGIAVLAVAIVSALGAAFWLRYGKDKEAEGPSERTEAIKLVGSDGLELPPRTIGILGVKVAPVQKSTQPRKLELAGSLGIDTDRLARVHTRFAGEVMQIGEVPDEASSGETKFRPLGFGDKVEKNQLMAVLWSKDLGEKKSELVGAISMQRLHEETLKRLEKFANSVPERTIREAQIAVEQDIVAVERARRTLRSWMLTEDEIKAIEAEAERIWERHGKRLPQEEKDWARVEVRAPFAGTILERNIAVRDIVDTTADLFKVADLGQLRVWANVYEEELPAVQTLSLPFPWQVRLKADPKNRSLPGRAEKIGEIVDPSDHTARVMGRVQNRDGRLKAGQFITATIDLPPDPNEVQVPAGALVEDGSESIVFVQPDKDKNIFVERHVQVARRTRELVYIRSVLKPKPGAEATAKDVDDLVNELQTGHDQKKVEALRKLRNIARNAEDPSVQKAAAQALAKEGQPASKLEKKPHDTVHVQPLKAGERVVIAGAVELKAELDDQRSAKTGK